MYTIDWMERKQTSTGKDKIDATMKMPDGSLSPTATIWSDFPDYATLAPGSVVDGDLKQNDKGYWTLYPKKPVVAASTFRPRVAGGAGVAKAQETKAEHIKEAQDNKNQGIMIAAAFRDATALSIEMMRAVPNDESPLKKSEILALHKELRDWYIEGWKDVEKSLDVPF